MKRCFGNELCRPDEDENGGCLEKGLYLWDNDLGYSIYTLSYGRWKIVFMVDKLTQSLTLTQKFFVSFFIFG